MSDRIGWNDIHRVVQAVQLHTIVLQEADKLGQALPPNAEEYALLVLLALATLEKLVVTVSEQTDYLIALLPPEMQPEATIA